MANPAGGGMTHGVGTLSRHDSHTSSVRGRCALGFLLTQIIHEGIATNQDIMTNDQ